MQPCKTLLSLICFFYFFCCTANADPIISKKVELQQVAAEIKAIQFSLTQDQQQQTDIHDQLKTIELILANLSNQINNINISLQIKRQELIKLKTDRQLTQTNLNKQDEALAEQVRSAYNLGNINAIKIILNQENPNTLSRYLGYYRYLTEQRLQLITSIKQTLLALTQNMQAITTHQQSLTTLLREKQEQLTEQKSAQKLRQQLIAQINREVQSKQQELTTLLANQQALQTAINQLQFQPNTLNHKLFSQLQGKLHWPTKGTITANFGSLLDVGDQRLAGVIIKAPIGTPVRAVASGKVIFASWLRGFGLLVIIDHGNNYMSLYARNQALQVKVGKQVNSADIIATLGNTGGYATSSLYFEIRQNGIPVNPRLWCRYT